MSFLFEQYADVPSAQLAFEAAFPAGSPAQLAIQTFADMGAQCKSTGPASFTCRYLERRHALVGFAWHVLLDCAGDGTIKDARIALTMLGP
jgi:hypothetical protein